MSTCPDRATARLPLKVIALALLFAAHAGAREPAANFYNVLAPEGADPWVYRHSDGVYYLTLTTETNVTLWRSPTLSGVAGGEKRVVWTPPAAGPGSRNLWAPELHFLRGKWYIYYAADDGENENHRMYVLENSSPDPFEGEFVSKGKIGDPAADRWAIDGTVLAVGEQLYFVWSGWEGATNVRQNLYIAPMKTPVTLGGPRVEISRPTFPWERVGTPNVNEGPQVVVRGDTVNLVYSASGSWTDDYCLGLLTARVGSDLLAPESWSKRPEPMFKSGQGVFGPGHASFVASPDGKEDWVVYHAARFQGSGWTRNVRAQRFTWNADGTPSFGLPVPADTPIALPGGEKARDRYEAERAELAGEARVVKQAGASGGALVGRIATPASHLKFTVSAPRAGKYVMAVRFRDGIKNQVASSHRVSVNGVDRGAIGYAPSGRGNWSNALRAVELKEGRNRIRFSKGDGLAEIDCLDLAPAP